MYIELKTSSAFSFLEGASLPEEIAREAARLEYPAIALLDRDGLYGAPRFYKACLKAGVRPLVGARISLKEGVELSLLVEDQKGYQNLCQLLTQMKLNTTKGCGKINLDTLESYSTKGLVCLTSNLQGPLSTKISRDGFRKSSRILDRLKMIFGPKSVFVEIQRHFLREQERLNQILVDLSDRNNVPLLASNGVLYAHQKRRPLQDILTCIRHKKTLRKAGRLLSINSERYLKPPAEMECLFSDFKVALRNSFLLSKRLNFTMKNLGYRFPSFPPPAGETMNSYLRKLTRQGARERYHPYHQLARRQIEKELLLVEKLDLAGYFLIVWDLVQFCKTQGILVQGRGSAANSSICYSLGITAVDPIGMDLLFERFLSEERKEWPDIDIDLPSGERREKVIQYIYKRYGKLHAAMTATVITYRSRNAARDIGKVLGFIPEDIDRLSKNLTRWEDPVKILDTYYLQKSRLDTCHHEIRIFIKLWRQIQNLPRHLGQHSGGMVIARNPLNSIVPLENSSMPGRRIIQWDKEDCADLGIIKIDLLGLGMMSVLQDAIQLVRQHSGKKVDLSSLPEDDPKSYELLQNAETIGLFQVESRAQMMILPRLKPCCFYDLVIQLSIIRPGPIVGQMVHPYLKRRAGLEPITYPHPSLKPILKRTLGIPIFQEQILKIAMKVAGFSGGTAEELRRALNFKRSTQRIEEIKVKLRQGMKKNGIVGEKAETIINYIASFSLYGFPESHSASFALITYASAYLKSHFPAAFYASLLNNQPMGFYHPATLVKDAQHRGLRVRPIDVSFSNWRCTIEADGSLRLGFLYAQGLHKKTGLRIIKKRQETPFQNLEDFVKKCQLGKSDLVTLSEIGAFNCFNMKRREALWQIEKLSRPTGPLFRSISFMPEDSYPLDDMDAFERLQADYHGTHLTTGPHPLELIRKSISEKGAIPVTQLSSLENFQRVRVAGCIIARQRPSTAKGFVFLSLEDETGISNIVINPRVFKKNKDTLINHPFLLIEGILQKDNNIVSILADCFWVVKIEESNVFSHDFH